MIPDRALAHFKEFARIAFPKNGPRGAFDAQLRVHDSELARKAVSRMQQWAREHLSHDDEMHRGFQEELERLLAHLSGENELGNEIDGEDEDDEDYQDQPVRDDPPAFQGQPLVGGKMRGSPLSDRKVKQAADALSKLSVRHQRMALDAMLIIPRGQIAGELARRREQATRAAETSYREMFGDHAWNMVCRP
jgi:hypothetical protein